MKILIIEDEAEIAATLKDELESDYAVDISLTGKDGEYYADFHTYDLIILDLGLPDKDGLEVCQNLRNKKIKSLILVLSANTDLRSKLSLLDFGADDYLTKPFEMGELKARIRALTRRKLHGSSTNIIKLKGLTLDLNARSVKRAGKSIFLRPKEFYILEYLIRNAGHVITREMIMNNLWSYNTEASSNLIDVHIKYIRDKVDKPFDQKLIKTIPGEGYIVEK